MPRIFIFSHCHCFTIKIVRVSSANESPLPPHPAHTYTHISIRYVDAFQRRLSTLKLGSLAASHKSYILSNETKLNADT